MAFSGEAAPVTSRASEGSEQSASPQRGEVSQHSGLSSSSEVKGAGGRASHHPASHIAACWACARGHLGLCEVTSM